MIAVKVVNGEEKIIGSEGEKKRETRVQKVAKGAVDGSLAVLCRSEKRGVGRWGSKKEGTRVSNFKQSPATRSSGIAESGLVRLSVQ